MLYADFSEYIKPKVLPRAIIFNTSSAGGQRDNSCGKRVTFADEEQKVPIRHSPLRQKAPPIKVYNTEAVAAAVVSRDNEGEGGFHHVRRQHDEEVERERNEKILEESLELSKRDEDRTRPFLRQDDTISILSYLFQWGGSLIDKLKD